jgi:SagB-type dehydrogenase family enzyme
MTDATGTDTLSQTALGATISLPKPGQTGAMSVEEAIARRRSVRDFTPDPLDLGAISQLLWSAQGITSAGGHRAAPSAGARYPLEVCLVCSAGLFHYEPSGHALAKVAAADLRGPLAEAAFGQQFVADAPISLVFAAIYERTMSRYGERGVRYVHIDLGHAAENVHLQAEALGLGSCAVGAFDDEAVARVLGLPAEQKPLYIIPVGRGQM